MATFPRGTEGVLSGRKTERVWEPLKRVKSTTSRAKTGVLAGWGTSEAKNNLCRDNPVCSRRKNLRQRQVGCGVGGGCVDGIGTGHAAEGKANCLLAVEQILGYVVERLYGQWGGLRSKSKRGQIISIKLCSRSLCFCSG